MPVRQEPIDTLIAHVGDFEQREPAAMVLGRPVADLPPPTVLNLKYPVERIDHAQRTPVRERIHNPNAVQLANRKAIGDNAAR